MLIASGQLGSNAVFVDDDKAVIIDVDSNIVLTAGAASEIKALTDGWPIASPDLPVSVLELAIGAIANLDITVTASAGRMYTVPKTAALEARKALTIWHKSHIGGTPVGLAVARRLVDNAQVDFATVENVAAFFGNAPTDQLSVQLRGGKSAARWAAGIVAKQATTAMTADGFLLSPEAPATTPIYSENPLNPFQDAFDHEEDYGPEFLVRVRMDGSGCDRLYRIDADAQTYVWDGDRWENAGLATGDAWHYDQELDDPYDDVDKEHVVIDPESAVILAARFSRDGFTPVPIETFDPEEADIVTQAVRSIDWELLDFTLTAAGNQDGNYTPEERSENAGGQVRDQTGRFAATGTRVVVGGDASRGSGSITRVNGADKTVDVKLDNGKSITVPGNMTQRADTLPAVVNGLDQGKPIAPFDATGILGEPRVPIDRPLAEIPGTLPPISSTALTGIMTAFPAWVQSERSAGGVTPVNTDVPSARVGAKNPSDVGEMKSWLKKNGSDYTADPREHPLLKDFLKKNPSEYEPILAAATPEQNAPDNAQKPKNANSESQMTPETSDVQPLFAALVAPEDPRAVIELISIVPTSASNPQPMVYKRRDGAWKPDEGILSDLNSPTPPPIVPLQQDALKSVLDQVDLSSTDTAAPVTASLLFTVLFAGPVSALIAAGGADRNRGGAETLRRYWTVGKGGLKIRWNSPGDWSRCVRHLSKYLGNRAKGYCALRHKEMTGHWTGDKANLGVASVEMVIDNAMLAAGANYARERVLVASGEMPPTEKRGGMFRIPIAIPEGVESGDGRVCRKGSLTIRDLPIPLLWQIKTADGHKGSVVVGRIDQLKRLEGDIDGIGEGIGRFDTGPYGREAERLVREKFIRGVSADLDNFEASEEAVPTEEKTLADGEKGEDREGEIAPTKLYIDKARIMAVTMLPKPAFQQAGIEYYEPELVAEPVVEQVEENMVPDGVYVDDSDPAESAALVACAMTAGVIPLNPPREWFQDPKLDGPSPITVTDDGRVFGHVASWDQDHIGMKFGTRAPRSRSGYAYFHTGVCKADDGALVPVGQLTMGGGHAPLDMSSMQTAQHYDRTSTAVADVHAGEDKFGIWVAGALRPGIQPEQIRALRASAPSGDWRNIKGRLEMVAVLQVNVPGFPIARARVASGQPMSLVAAGAYQIAALNDPVAELRARMTVLESMSATGLTLDDAAMAARERMASAIAERDGQRAVLFAAAENARMRMMGARMEQRTELSTQADAVTARFALLAAGPPITPAGDETPASAEGKAPAASEPLRTRKYDAKTQPRDGHGQFREILARLKDDIGADSSQDVMDQIVETENLDSAGDYKASVEGAAKLIDMVDRMDTGALNDDSMVNIKAAAAELGRTIANLPLPFEDHNATVRYSDLPPVLKSLIDKLILRTNDKIGEKEGKEATKMLTGFRSGADMLTQPEISSELSTLLRLVT